MTNLTGRNCQVAVTSVDDSAVAPDDYNAFSGGLFDLINVASDFISISVIDDGFVEGPEAFTINTLTVDFDPQCQLGDASATITITIADGEPAAPAGSVSIPTNHPLALLLLTLAIGWTVLRRRGGQ
ncbi:MAG: Calx-beta domain-containing protein [Gammaproteobacteria bacterium]